MLKKAWSKVVSAAKWVARAAREVLSFLVALPVLLVGIVVGLCVGAYILVIGVIVLAARLLVIGLRGLGRGFVVVVRAPQRLASRLMVVDVVESARVKATVKRAETAKA